MRRWLLPAAVAALCVCGCNARVGRVEMLWLLWVVPALVAFFVYSFRRKQVLLHRFVSRELFERINAGVSRSRQVLKAALIVVGLAAGVLALAELEYGFTWEEVTRRGVDIVVTLDVSDSMLVEDAETGGKLTRLERAKREIMDLLRMMEGDRIGLVAFAGSAFIECPLTLDYAAAEVFVDTLDTDLIPVKGTAIGTAIAKSLDALHGGATARPADGASGGERNDSRAIILITDGEDHSGHAEEMAERAKAQGVRIFTIGIGRDEGSPIPDGHGGFRRGRDGEMILSRLDEPALQKIALNTGGRYVRSVTGDVDLEKIYLQGIKATLEDQELGSKRRQHWQDRFQWLLAVSILALGAEPLIGERRRRLPAAGKGATT